MIEGCLSVCLRTEIARSYLSVGWGAHLDTPTPGIGGEGVIEFRAWLQGG
ncbi:hypothetical protein HMPREF3198_02130 [Winkia neuii]|nr:hypothetical protein HMPREF3198_02130 [Winkia neuii]